MRRRKTSKLDPHIGQENALDQLVERWEFVEYVHREFENTIKAAIYTVLSESWKYRDYSVDIDDIYQDVLIGPVFKFADKLQTRGEASLKRRLYRLAETHTEDYPMKKALVRGEALDRALKESPQKIRHLVQIKVMVSPDEMASEKLSSEAA